MQNHKSILDAQLNAMLHGLTLSQQALPQCPEIQLHLVDPISIPEQITESQFQSIWQQTAYWAFCWGSGQALAKYILAHPDKFKGKTLVDFGSGSGVVAIAAAKVGAMVTACDIDPICKTATQLNCEINNVTVNWCDDIEQISETFQWLTAADVLYDRRNLVWLDRFNHFACNILVADSRIKEWPAEQYQLISSIQSNTVPDVGESTEFGSIRLWQWKKD